MQRFSYYRKGEALRSAWDTLGEPTDSPTWRQKVAEVKAGLTKGR